MLNSIFENAVNVLNDQLGYDGFLRIQLGSVLTSRFAHLFSDVAPSDVKSLAGDEGMVVASGFSEWHSLDPRAISLGWDWEIKASRTEMALVRVGLPRSNVMLVDRKGRDFGWLESLEALATVVDALPWREEVWHGMPCLSPA
ncbi:MAG: DUF4902 domain-containing protein [Pseudomonadales bacterium]